MNRPEILEAARKCVCGERQQDYGTPENNFETIGLLWGTYLRAAHPKLKWVFAPNEVTPKDVANMMALMKIARAAVGNNVDSFIDLAGYAACGGEIATQENGEKTPEIPNSLQKAIAIDFDGCLCENKYPEIGRPNWKIIRKAIEEKEKGTGLILWTCRQGAMLKEAIDAAAKWGIHFDAVNESLPSWRKAFRNNPRKVGADEYWDDKAVTIIYGNSGDETDD